MLGIEQFRKIQEYKGLGISKHKVSEILDLSYKMVDSWWDRDEEYFLAFEKEHEFMLDNYRGYIVEQIKFYPAINNTVLLRKVSGEFKDFRIPPSAFYRYVKKVREQTGFLKPPRIYKVRESTEPGFEAQVDFGQYAMRSMYGNNVRVYFFCMVLSYSRMKFVYFSIDPFTAKKVIEAHDYAFRYFGGRPQMIVYDQDRTMTVSENLGSPIFVKEFEDYVKETGYSVYLCRGYDPETKGKVENNIGNIKRDFLDGRTYHSIDRLREIEHDARLPKKEFSHKTITEGLELELTKIKNFDFKNWKANILIVGDCCTGKTSVAVEIAKAAIEKEARVIYETVDNLLFIIKVKKRRWSHILKADLIILDELFYVESTKEELLEIYRALTFLGETRSLILITNRGLSEWKRMDVDKHLIETLQQWLMHDVHLIHLK